MTRIMRLNPIVVWSAMAVMLAAVPWEASAQVRIGVSVEWWDWIGDGSVGGRAEYRSGRADRYEPVHTSRPVVIHERDVYVATERGPAFCRSGRGHPVHGWEWCVKKGFVRLDRAAPRRARPRVARHVWYPASFGEVYFRPNRLERAGRPLVHAEIVAILGRGVVDDLYARAGYRRPVPLEGRWYPSAGRARVLQLRAGSTPLAELTDLDGDRRVDRIFLADSR